MKKIFTLFCLFIVLNICKPSVINAQVDVNDSLALVDLYNSTDGPNWTRSTNWLTTARLGKWYGVETGKHRVISIYLQGNQLSGNIPAELGNLTSLNILYLNDNQLSGSIPAELGNLTNLQRLSLFDNQLSGSIPAELSNLTNLQVLSLYGNQLSGSIPAELGNLTSLNFLDLNNNQLSGSIPVELSNLTNLINLKLYGNQLSGNIPVELGNIPNLQVLYLNNNQLSGNIPAELGNLVYLNYLILSGNQLSGNIPSELGNLTKLIELDLNNNQLSGSIPVMNLNLVSLNLSNNHFSGNISAIANLKNLRGLYLNNNQFSGSIPELGELIYNLRLDSNQLIGTIPDELGNLKDLHVLSLLHNKLRGKIPTTFSQLTNLEELNLRDNRLTDTVPSFFASLPNLTKLLIQSNHFTFNGIEQLAQQISFKKFRYGFQKKIEINQTGTKLSVYAGGTLRNNTYKWFNNGVLVSTINGDSTYTPPASGNYSVEVTNSIATELTLKSDTVNVTTFTAIAHSNASVKENYKNNFLVYPNPAKNIVTVSFTATGNYSLKLSDANGNVLQTKTGVAVNNKNIVQLNVGNYVAGSYFITVTNAKKEAQTLRFNKQ